MDIEADAFLLERIDQFRSQAGKINPEPLHAIVDFGVDRFNNGITTTVVDIHSGDATGFHVIEEAAIAHAAHSSIAWSHSGAIGVEGLHAPVTNQLPAEQ